MPEPTRLPSVRRLTAVVAAVALGAAACAGSPAGTPATTGTGAPTTLPPLPTSSSSTATTGVTTTVPATTPARAPDWTIRPVLDRVDTAWESVYLDPGAVIADTGTLHMFYDGGPDWPAPATVGHAVSDDGLTWERRSADGLLTGSELPWRGISIYASDAIVLPDGTWAIYFHTIERIQSTVGSRIGMAVAAEPGGPWAVLPEPVLEPAGSGAWDGAAVLNPNVLEIPGGFRMYYDGHGDASGSDEGRAIGTAFSPDGYVWTRDAGPILTAAAGGWRSEGAYDPNVEMLEGRYVMAFWSTRPDPDRGRTDELLGLARSEDGITWTPDPEPVLSSTDYGIADVLLSSTAVHDGHLLIYFDALVPAWSSTIWAAFTPIEFLTTG